ncbi:hypothetical protein NIES2101_20525 [Calothrix sp. HK-06]|nr:hypothetical protein NIES2101_20525 [Calothrix sp. HK-06]
MPTVRSKGIAVLLLDAENLQLSLEMEGFLQQQSSFQITCKIAFANWRTLGNVDQSLYERGYDLIQVPGAKDAADGKMITFGCQLREFYPKAKTVFVCSSDAVMLSLCNCLLQQELEVYRVVKQDNQIKVTKYPNGSTLSFGQQAKSNKANNKTSTTQSDDRNRAIIEKQLLNIIRSEGDDKTTIDLSKLGMEYNLRHKEAVTKALKKLKLGGNFMKFLTNSKVLKLENINKVYKVSIIN